MIRNLTVLLFAAVAASAEFRFEPPMPTTHSFVVLHERDYGSSTCVPTATVTREGRTVHVAWTVPSNRPCTADHAPWEARVPIGVLEAGSYDVRMTMNGQPYEGGTTTLVVTDATPSLALYKSEPIVSTAGGGEITLEPSDLSKWEDFCQPAQSVTVGGVSATSKIVDCRLVITVPAMSAGAKDVVVRTTNRTYTTNALVWVANPSSTPDPKFYERILIPVLYQGPGAYDSFWLTGAFVQNQSEQPWTWFHDVAQASCDGPGCGPRFFPKQWINLGVHGNRPKGMIVFAPRAISDRLAFGHSITDSSRTEQSWGTEMRVVREREARIDAMILPGVPFDPRYRVTLRVYALDGGPSSVIVRLDGNIEQTVIVELQPSCGEPPCKSNEPAFASVDVRQLFPDAPNAARALEITPYPFTVRRHWAVVSITNNETQMVSMVTPQ